VPDRRRRPLELWLGAAILAALWLAGAAAPLLATSQPWLARENGRIGAPAFREILGRAAPPGTESRSIVSAPVPHDPNRIDLGAILEPPSRRHWLGTDALGRDLLARLLHGARISVSVGLAAAALALLVGVPLGAIAGFRGGVVDSIVSRAVEATLAIPALLLALALLSSAAGWLAALPESLRVAVVIGVTGWMPVTRYVRAEFSKLRGSDLVLAARASGATDARIMSRHVLPSAVAPVLVTAAFSVGAAIVLEAGLSFLGLGVHPPTPTWGSLLAEAREPIRTAWWPALFPTLALFLSTTGCSLLAEGIRDRLDPRARPG
jgi:peptide/nickel transport system permease protein